VPESDGLNQLGQLVRDDADAGDVRINGPEIAAKLDRRIWFKVPCVDGAEAAVQEEEDKRDVFRRLTASRGAGLSG